MDSTLLSILSTIITVAFLYFLVPDTSNAARRLRWIIALCDKLMTEATQWRFSDGAADILGLGNSNDVTCSLPESGERGADSGLKDAAISWKPPTLRTLGAGIQHLGLRDFLQQPRSKSPPGLGNLDNSCFQNSVIQVEPPAARVG